MTTRFYFSGTNTTAQVGSLKSAVIPSSWSAGWNATPPITTSTDNASGIAVVDYGGSIKATNTNIVVAADGTLNHFNAVWRFVSAPLDTQTIAGNIKGQFQCLEALATDIYTLAVGIKIIKPDGSDRAALLAPVASNTVTQPPAFDNTTATNRKLLDAADSASIALTSQSASAGDRLVIEIGFKALSTLTGNATLHFSTGQSITDLPEDNTDTDSTKNSWLEFDSNLSFLTAPYVLGVGSNPLDIATASANEPVTLTFAQSGASINDSIIKRGDLLIMVGQIQVATTGQISVSATGGQSWTGVTEVGANDQCLDVYWANFNGSFLADPSLAFAAQSGTQPCTAVMIVVRDPSGTNAWAVDNAYSGTSQASSATVTVNGVTTTGNNNFILAGIGLSASIGTWSALSGTNWSNCGNPQYRNSAGSDQTLTFAAQGQTAAAATNNVSKTVSSANTGMSFIMSWKSPIPVPFIADLPYIIKQSINRAAIY